jgi:hypothetical protein
MRKFLLICCFVICGAPAEASQIATQWYFGQWSCMIDGRPATMVWKVVNASEQTCNGGACTQTSGVRVVGWFKERTGPWVRLYRAGSSDVGLRILYNNVDPWVLNRKQPGYAVGHTTWQGQRYPLECRKS